MHFEFAYTTAKTVKTRIACNETDAMLVEGSRI